MTDITQAMKDASEKRIFQPVVIAYLDVQGDPISMWTGNGDFMPSGTSDPVLNGKVFLRSESFADISEIETNQSIGGPVTISLKANDLDESALRQVVRDKRLWLGRKAYVWLGLYDDDAKQVLSDPIRIKSGIIAGADISRNEGNTSLNFTIDSDLQNARGAEFLLISHPNAAPGDTFTSFMLDLANKPNGFQRSSGFGLGIGGDRDTIEPPPFFEEY